jgi:hypothetical protein
MVLNGLLHSFMCDPFVVAHVGKILLNGRYQNTPNSILFSICIKRVILSIKNEFRFSIP